MPRISIWPLFAFIVLFAGCTTGPLKDVSLPSPFQSKAEQTLAEGVKQYEDGHYRESQANLQSALDQGLPGRADQVKAHKYLAFIHCASNREKQCRDEFRKALDVNPAFELTAAEAGHPVWGPVFRSVKRSGR
ncbi:MAG: TssQ family T6SS-associated lipoprotein [Betaproteobacteria bacterium]|nr:TssQ family T6SS-associated lipoprotein [Betaproteobacteria bacterium]